MFTDLRMLVEDSLRNLVLVFEAAFEGMAKLDASLNFVLTNDGFCKMIGYSKEELTKTSIYDLIDKDDHQKVKDAWESISDTGRAEVEICAIRKDKSWFYQRITLVPVFGPCRDIIGCYCFGTDITSIKESQEQLRISEEKFRGAFAYSSIGMGICDLNGKWLKVNKAFCELIGYPENDMLNLDYRRVTHSEDLPRKLELMERLVKREIESLKLETRYIHKNGSCIQVEITVSMVEKDDEPLYFVVQVEDITNRKASENELHTFQNIISDDMNRQMYNAINSFISGVGHEIKSPLQAIDNSVDLICEKFDGITIDGEVEKELLKTCKAATTSIEAIINNITNFGGLKSGNLDGDIMKSILLDTKKIGLKDIVQETVDIFKCTTIYKECQSKVELFGNFDIDVVVSNGVLRQILMNLLTNAQKAIATSDNRKKGLIKLQVYEKRDHVVLEIEDNGRGIPEDITGKLFSPFFRAYRDIPGMGLGLFFSKTFANNANIDLALVFTEPGKTIFAVTFDKQ